MERVLPVDQCPMVKATYGRAYIQNRAVPADQLFRELKQLIGTQKDQLVVIKADRAVILNKAVKVMDLAKAAGAGRLCLATEKGI